MRTIDLEDASKALAKTAFDEGNEVLYRLCREKPLHQEEGVIIAKILLIGRVYAAAIERRKERGATEGDNFYIDTVAPKIQNSGIDAWIRELPESLSIANSSAVVQVHCKVMKLFYDISGLEKRSLASKYLHFHRPDLFFIFDTRAMEGIRLVTPHRAHLTGPTAGDKTYEHFYRRCLWLRNDLQQRHGMLLKPRDLDKVLLSLIE